MQEKLKKAFQTVKAMPIEDFENYRLITDDRLMDAEIKGNFERLESLLNEEKSSNSAQMQLVLIKIQELNSKMEQEKSATEARISELI